MIANAEGAGLERRGQRGGWERRGGDGWGVVADGQAFSRNMHMERQSFRQSD